MLILILIIILATITIRLEIKKYKKTDYYKQTQNNYFDVYFDPGKLGEYDISQYLENLEGYKKYLFNTYITKDDETTTEIDVILIHNSGIYVFESKNYSGWIFGTETQSYWTQVLPSGKNSTKYKFFNPIIQNKIHIKWLSTKIDANKIPLYSYIIFSDRCTLKKINLTTNNHIVINRYDILKTLKYNYNQKGNLLTNEEIDNIYNELYKYTQIDKNTKEEHIKNIQNKKKY